MPTKTWFGGVLEGMRDAGGTMYMRNRYYDPATGQFTQTDPIGIAGGLNTYGFANGDPVTYSDPYGLAGIPALCLAAPAVCGAAAATVARGASLLARTPAAQRALQAASARAHQLGRAGEAVVSRATGLARNTTQRLGNRIPDFVDRAANVFHEAKNVQRLGLTRQLREMIVNLQPGQRLIIHVRAGDGTRVSQNLNRYVEQGLVEIRRTISN